MLVTRCVFRRVLLAEAIAALVTTAIHHHHGKFWRLCGGRSGATSRNRHRLERLDLLLALGNASLTNHGHLPPNASIGNRLLGQLPHRLGTLLIAAQVGTGPNHLL